MPRLGWRIGALALLGGVLVPTVALAQAGFYVTPSFSLEQVYDDNLNSTASNHESDFISRFTPAIQAGYQSEPLTILGRYSFDAEVYADHPELNSPQVRQRASIDLNYLPTRLLTLSVNGTYTQTQTPRELNSLTGLEAGRASGKSLSLGPSITYQFDPLTSISGSYAFTRDELAGGTSTEAHNASLGLDRGITPRDTLSLFYILRFFHFSGESTSASDETDNVVTLGWRHAFTPLTSLTLRGGARFSGGAVDPEVLASIGHQLKKGGLSFTYAKSQATVIGQAGTVNTDSFSASVNYEVLRLLQVSAVAAFFRNTQGGSEAKAYTLNLGASYPITAWLALVGSYQFTFQQGILGSATTTAGGPEQDIFHNIVSVNLVATYPMRVY